MYDPEKPLISVHIPKCAGSSFSELLKRWFGSGFRPHYHDEQTATPPQRYELYHHTPDRKRISGLCIHGHFNARRGNGVEQYYPLENQVITIIRDPWDLHVSNYFHVIRSHKQESPGANRNGKPHPIIDNRWSLDDYLIHQGKSCLIDFLPGGISLQNYHELLEEKFIFIGVTEQLDLSVKKLSALLNKPYIPPPIRNAGEKPDRPSPRQKQIFMQQNELECRIYEYVLESFNRQ